MSVIESALDPNSEEYRQNRDALLAAVEEFRAIEQAVVDTAEGKRAKFEKRGQLLPHERISRLLDTGSPFLSLMNLAGYKMHDDKDGTEAGGGTIAGIGYVSGVRCLVTASNSAIKGGTISPSGLHKTLRLQRIAMENKLPVVSLVESGGANLNYAAEVFVDGARTFANQARLSAAGIPQITVVHGNATAGGAYQPGLSDYVVVVRERAKMFLAGPPLLKAATGEIATDEELGGAEMHAGTAGTAEYLAENDADGIRQARDLVKLLGWRRAAPAGNNGPITPRGAAKAAQFIQLCDQTRRPLLFLHNTTGFMVGTDAEQNGVIKHGSKMLQAVANARVPKISIVVGGSYGAGNYAMCGRGLDPRFIFAWPNSKVAVMGGQQAGMVLRIVAEAKQRANGIEPDEKVLDMLQQTTAQKLDSQSTALYGTARLWDDGIIDPRDTRRVVAYALDICADAQHRELHPNAFGVARL